MGKDKKFTCYFTQFGKKYKYVALAKNKEEAEKKLEEFIKKQYHLVTITENLDKDFDAIFDRLGEVFINTEEKMNKAFSKINSIIDKIFK